MNQEYIESVKSPRMGQKVHKSDQIRIFSGYINEQTALLKIVNNPASQKFSKMSTHLAKKYDYRRSSGLPLSNPNAAKASRFGTSRFPLEISNFKSELKAQKSLILGVSAVHITPSDSQAYHMHWVPPQFQYLLGCHGFVYLPCSMPDTRDLGFNVSTE